MIIEIEVNNKKIKANKGDTILTALNQNGINVPTLCNMKNFTPTGACRMCVVEVEGKPSLIPSCAYPVQEWMKIRTHSPRVIKARKTIVELLLANHPDDCLYCERNGNCELQHFAEELNIRQRRFARRKTMRKIDHSSPSLVRDPSKCLLCGRCVRICEEVQSVSAIEFINRGNRTVIGTAFNKVLNFSSCINCGQCIMVCPTGAIYEQTNFSNVQEALHDPDIKVMVHYAPSITVSIAEEFGLKPGKDNSGIINSALRKIGFDKVFDTSFGSDLTIIEEAEELFQRIQNNDKLPLISSCCPGWVKYAEQFKPEFIPHLSTCKSPQQMTGAILKTWYAEKEGIKPENIYSVSVMPCTAKKFEARREEMKNKGIADVDAVITTRELARLIRLNGINIKNIEAELTDSPLGTRSSAGKLVGASGGITEAILRTLYLKLNGEEMRNFKIPELRGGKGIKKARVKLGKTDIGVAVVSGLGNASKFLNELSKGKEDVQYVEIMACPGGCIGGGGQPLGADDKTLKSRMNTIYEIDENETIKVAHKNPYIIEIYENFLIKPMGEKSCKLLHTHYVKREVLL